MGGFGSLYDNMLDSLKMKWLNERISNLDGIQVMSAVNINIIFVLSLKKLVNLSAKIQSLEKPNKTDQRNTQFQTEELNGEPISVSRFKVREEQPKVVKQPT